MIINIGNKVVAISYNWYDVILKLLLLKILILLYREELCGITDYLKFFFLYLELIQIKILISIIID